MEQLVEAQRGHLEVGEAVYVRGRKAVIIDVDYPNVFWRFVGEQVVKHRSHQTAPKELFQVTAGTPVRQIRKNTTSSMVDFTDSDNDDEEIHGARRFDTTEEDAGNFEAAEVEFPAFEDEEIPEAFVAPVSPKAMPRAADDEDSEEDDE
jgi:hypothetical protein